jgi:hypothetical protein
MTFAVLFATVTIYEDYREVGGLSFPFRITDLKDKDIVFSISGKPINREK